MKGKSKLSGAISKKSQMPLRAVRKEMLFSFRDFDHTQGQTFAQWGNDKLLRLLLDKLKEYSRKTVLEAEQASFKIYGVFPLNSRFTVPKHIIPDAIWASMHIQGKECIAAAIPISKLFDPEKAGNSHICIILSYKAYNLLDIF
jgi:hypothetical protein